MSLTPIYDDLMREFEGIILASKAVEADTVDQPAGGELPIDEAAPGEAVRPAATRSEPRVAAAAS